MLATLARYGGLCSDCRECGECMAGRSGESTVLPCFTCEGKADAVRERCQACGGQGQTEIVGCPLDGVTGDVWRTMDAIAWASGDSPILPVAGGMLDQASLFMDALAHVRMIRARLEADQRRRRQAAMKGR